MRVNLGCGQHYASGWVNLDVRDDNHTRPDRLVDPADPFADFDAGTVGRVYLGHVLEHIPWPRVHDLLVETRRVLTAHGQVCVVGPDCYRVLHEWRDGRLDWEFVASTLEHADRTDLPAERLHWWDPHEQRVVDALTAAGFTARSVPVDPVSLDGWPVVAFTSWQCAAIGAPLTTVAP